MGYKIKRIMLGTQQVRPDNKIILDFQNNGLSGCTRSSIRGNGTATYGYDSGQGVYLNQSNGAGYSTGVSLYLPASVQKGTLKRIKLYFYKSVTNAGFGLRDDTTPQAFRYKTNRDETTIGFVGLATANIGDYTGEGVLDMEFNGNTISGTCYGVSYTVTNATGMSRILNEWNNQRLGLAIDIWGNAGKNYIRKAEIYTE